jgi:LPXTG-motif cell wall-anchored protein
VGKNVKSNIIAGYIIYAVAFAILVFLLAQGFFIPLQNETLNLSLAIVALVLLGIGYFLRRKTKKSETKQNPS